MNTRPHCVTSLVNGVRRRKEVSVKGETEVFSMYSVKSG